MKKRYLWLAALLFISTNIILIIYGEEKVAHTSYIPDWSDVTEKDMYETLMTNGVIDYTNEEHIYFNDEDGIFVEFLVEEGERIFTGDVLYAYEVEHYDEVNARLTHEIQQHEEEIKSLKQAIKKMEQQTGGQTTLEITFPDSDETIEMKQDDPGFTFQKEQYIIEMEKQLNHTEAQLESLEKQLDDLQEQDKTIYVESPFAGKVTHKSLALTNPILTIESTDLHIKGELTERERMDVGLDMPVEIDLVENDNFAPFEGTISFVSEEPLNLSVDKESKYPFHVTFDEGDFGRSKNDLDEDEETEDNGFDDWFEEWQFDDDEDDSEAEANNNMSNGKQGDIHLQTANSEARTNMNEMNRDENGEQKHTNSGNEQTTNDQQDHSGEHVASGEQTSSNGKQVTGNGRTSEQTGGGERAIHGDENGIVSGATTETIESDNKPNNDNSNQEVSANVSSNRNDLNGHTNFQVKDEVDENEDDTDDMDDSDNWHYDDLLKPLQGYHVNLKITTKESLNTTVVDKNSIEHSSNDEEMENANGETNQEHPDNTEPFFDNENTPSDDNDTQFEPNEETTNTEHASDEQLKLDPTSHDQFDEEPSDLDESELDEDISDEHNDTDPAEHENNYETFVWKMDHDGKLKKQPVEQGIEMDNYIEIKNGVYNNDRVAINTRNNLKDNATFITPFKPKKSNWHTIFKDGSRKRSLLIGLLAR